MKATRLIVVISDIWSTEQLETAKACLIKGLEQVVNSGKCGGDLLDGIGHHCDSICSGSGSENPVIKLTNCEIELVMNADKSDVVNVINKAIQGGNAADAVIVLYVGEVTLPFGHWILRDGLFGSTDMHALLMIEAPQQQVIEAGHPNVLLVTPLPCDDWHIIEKKQLPYFSLYGYQLDKETIATGDGFPASLTGFVNAVADKISVSHIDTDQEGSQLKASIVTRSPSLYLFLDKGSASCPALLTLDGFAMLFNCGFNRNAEWRRYVRYYQQIDVGLLSHIAYNNLMGLHAYVGPDRQRINHMFVPSEAAAISDHHHSRPAPTLPQDVSNPFHVDLKTELGSMFAQLKSSGMQMSSLTVKAKSGTTLTANQIKPIQLFHKIGYGSLEMIPLCPFEDDVDMKKFHDDWKKSKYCNESLTKTMPSSAAVLLVWKPFSSKAPIKRIIYVGSKCAVRKNFPSMITTLHSNLDFLKQADYTPHDGLVKKPTSARKTTPPVSATSKATSKSADNNTLVTAKKAVPPASDKSSRPITVSAPPVHTAKELPAKRPQTAGGKPKSDPAKQQEPTKKAPATLATNSKPAVVATNSTPKKHQQPSAINKKQPIDNKPQTKEPGHAKPTKPKADKPGITNGQMPPHDVQHVLTTDMDTVPNGDNAVAVGDKPVAVDVPGAGAIDGDTCESIEPKPSTPDANSIVAVGTVECAITEHGEADFCDDTPEEITADQMKEMGYYDDEEEDKGRDKGCNPSGDGVNIAHLPMEGSFYGKDVLVEGTDPAGSNHATVEGWSQPLAMPMPVKDAAVTTAGNATKKSAAGKQQQSPLSINVDCLCVPCDLDKEDLRYLFETVKAATIYLQLEKPADLSKVLEMLLDEKEKDGASNGCHEPTKVIPSTADESFLMWAVDNNARMESCRVEVVADLSRCIISTFGTGGDHTDPGDGDSVAKGGFHGIKLEL